MTSVKMALSAELKLRDKHTQRICVRVGNDLSSLNDGIKELNVNVSQLLSDLVERERARGACAAGEEDEDSDEGSDEDETSKCELQCPAKRLKP